MRFEYLSAYADEISDVHHLFHEFVGRHSLLASIIYFFYRSLVGDDFAIFAMEHELDLLCAIEQSRKS